MAIPALLCLAQETLQCTVCYDLLRDPVAFSCGHVFCGSCAGRLLDDRPQCPLCNHPVPHKRSSIPLPTVSALSAVVTAALRALRRPPSAGRTPLLRTPPKARGAVWPPLADVSDAPETPDLRGVGAWRGADAAGFCALCRLDITNRAEMRPFLRGLLQSDASCDGRRVRQLCETSLAECLGPTWTLQPTETDGALVVHQMCLEWGVLRRPMTGAAWRLCPTEWAALRGGEEVCAFCARGGRCLVLCVECGKAAFHFPCARLTGSAVCEMSAERIGELRCAACVEGGGAE